MNGNNSSVNEGKIDDYEAGEMTTEHENPNTRNSNISKGRWHLSSILIIFSVFIFIFLVKETAILSQYLQWSKMDDMPELIETVLGWTEQSFQQYKEKILPKHLFMIWKNLGNFIMYVVLWFSIGYFWSYYSSKFEINQTVEPIEQFGGSYFPRIFVIVESLLLGTKKMSSFIKFLCEKSLVSVLIFILAIRYKTRLWMFCLTSLVLCMGIILIKNLGAEIGMRIIFNMMDSEWIQKNLSSKQRQSLDLIKALAEKEGFPVRNVCLTRKPTDLVFTGFNYYLIIEQSIVEESTDEEILGITAQQLGRYTNGDGVFRLLYEFMSSIPFPLSVPIIQSSELIFGSTGLAGIARPIQVAIVMAEVFHHSIILYLNPIWLAYTRISTDLADKNAVRLGYGMGLYKHLKNEAANSEVSTTTPFKLMTQAYTPTIERLFNLNKHLQLNQGTS